MFIYFVPTESKPIMHALDVQLNTFSPYQNCTSNSDCNNHEQCFKGKCYPTYRGTNFCNHFTGSWVLVDIDGKQFLKCTCRHPNIVTQQFDGGNCDVDVACSPNGQLISIFIQDLLNGECACRSGYKSVKYPRIGCEKLLPSETEKTICDSNEIPISQALSVYHSEYLNDLPTVKKCIKNPCSFNVLNGKPLNNTKFDSKYGCVCNPAYGNFGVKFENIKKYLITDGYDACANIFNEAPNVETRVRLFTYFYINGNAPKSFIQFTNVNKDHLVPSLQNLVINNNLQIDEIWPYNYSQYIFENEHFVMHTRECILETFLNIENCYERVMREKQMTDCNNILNEVPKIPYRHLQTYALLYKYPVCKYNSSHLAHLYNNRYILNPYLFSHKEYGQLLRSNGIEIFYGADNKWFVSFARSEFEKYENTSVFPLLKSLPPNVNVYSNSRLIFRRP